MKPPLQSAGPRRLGPLITRIAKRSAGRRGLPTAEILTNWRSIVGADLAPLTVPLQVSFPRGAGDGGTLKLRVAAGFGPIVAQQEPRIIARLNTYFGYGAVARLRLVQGPPLASALASALAGHPGSPSAESLAGASGEPSTNPAENGGDPGIAPPPDSNGDSDTLPALNRLRKALSARRKARDARSER